MSFDRDMAFADSNDPIARLAYRVLFPDAKFFAKNDTDNPAQRLGCDRALALANGDLISLDEKFRRLMYAQDILLEWQHFWPDGRTAPGWIDEHKNIEYLHCIYVPHRIGVLIGWRLLRKAWQIHGELWKKQYREIIGETTDKHEMRIIFRTRSIAVPTKVLTEVGVLVQVYSIPFPKNDSLPPPRQPPTPPRQGSLF